MPFFMSKPAQLKESLLNSEHIIYKINKSIKLLYTFDGILSYVGKETLLTKKTNKSYKEHNVNRETSWTF